jgi:hypothetical protein
MYARKQPLQLCVLCGAGHEKEVDERTVCRGNCTASLHTQLQQKNEKLEV